MKFSFIFPIIFLLLGQTDLLAQKKNANYQLHISRATSPVTIDGAVDEPAWQAAEVASDFWMVLPMDTSRAHVRTDVRMAYDDHNVYLSAVCYPGRRSRSVHCRIASA